MWIFDRKDRDRLSERLEAELTELRSSLEALEGRETTQIQPYDDREIRDAIGVIDSAIADLTLAVAEGIQHVDRAERRVRAVVARAKKRMDDAGLVDEGLDAEAAELRLIHGGGSEPEGVPPVHENVGDPGDQPSSVPGVTIRQLQSMRGL